jgi:hypothetical protein
MNNFETFDIGAWVVDGLTRHVNASPAGRKRKNKRPTVTVSLRVAAVAASAFLTIATPWLSMQAQTPFAETIASLQALRSADVIIGSPVNYWSRVDAEMRTWKRINSPKISDIPPFV